MINEKLKNATKEVADKQAEKLTYNKSLKQKLGNAKFVDVEALKARISAGKATEAEQALYKAFMENANLGTKKFMC